MFGFARNSGNKDKKRVVVLAGLWKYFFLKFQAMNPGFLNIFE